MNSLKMSLFISTFLFCHSVLANICVNTSSNYKMFGSVLRAGALMRGHELAFQDSKFSDYQFYSAEMDTDLSKQIQNMSTGACSIVLGLFTSRECLIAGPILKKNKLIGISSSCGHENIKEFLPYLYTAIPSISEFSYKVANYLNESNKLGKVIVVYQPTDVYSQTCYKNFKKKFIKSVIEVLIESDGKFDIKKFNNNEVNTIVFFTYPLPSARILMDLNNNDLINKNTSIIGASSWAFDVSVFRSIKPILEKAQSVIAPDIINWDKIRKSEFAVKFEKKFNREPLNIEILTYDVTKIAIKCYRDSLENKIYNSDQFQACMTKGQHHGVSGSFSFDKESVFAKRPLYLNNLIGQM